MNILFLSLSRFESFTERGIYSDLLRCFINNGHNVFAVGPRQKREGLPTELKTFRESAVLKVRVGNITKTSAVKKGMAMLKIERQYISAIKKYFPNIVFDLILYPTPPITLERIVMFVKKRDNAKAYLLLKDIFPQNAVDLGMMSKCGVKGVLYRWFRSKEKKLYEISDRIGCMSEANVAYLKEHNSTLDAEKIEVCPNSIEVKDFNYSKNELYDIRDRYGIPKDAKVFVYGGNLGRPQNIPFIIDCIRSVDDPNVFFLIAGDGTDFNKIDSFVKKEKPKNMKLLKRIGREDYEKLTAACDAGLIFLDYRFTIPNYPSRLLTYMQAGIPVLVCTDKKTDIGQTVVSNGFGWMCKSSSVAEFVKTLKQAVAELDAMDTDAEKQYLKKHFSVENSYRIILEGMKKIK